MVPVQLNEMENQFDHADDQDSHLDEIGKCDHDKPPFLDQNKRRGAKKRPPKALHEVGCEGAHRCRLIDSTCL